MSKIILPSELSNIIADYLNDDLKIFIQHYSLYMSSYKTNYTTNIQRQHEFDIHIP